MDININNNMSNSEDKIMNNKNNINGYNNFNNINQNCINMNKKNVMIRK